MEKAEIPVCFRIIPVVGLPLLSNPANINRNPQSAASGLKYAGYPGRIRIQLAIILVKYIDLGLHLCIADIFCGSIV